MNNIKDRTVRRPEVARLAAQLQAKNPGWTELHAQATAKAIVTGSKFLTLPAGTQK